MHHFEMEGLYLFKIIQIIIVYTHKCYSPVTLLCGSKALWSLFGLINFVHKWTLTIHLCLRIFPTLTLMLRVIMNLFLIRSTGN